MAMRITSIDKDFILNALFLEETTLLMRLNVIIETKISSIDTYGFTVEVAKEKTHLFKRGLEIEFGFNFQGKSMNFKGYITSMNINAAQGSTVLAIKKPEFIISNLLRKYERVVPSPDAIRANVEIDIEKPDFYIKKDKYVELLGDTKDIQAVYSKSIYDKILAFFKDKKLSHDIEFFSSEVKEYSFEAILVKTLEKALYFPLNHVNMKNSKFLISSKEILRSFGGGKEILEEHKGKLNSRYLVKYEEKMIEKGFSFIAHFPLRIESFIVGYFVVKGKEGNLTEKELEDLTKNLTDLAFEYATIKKYKEIKYTHQKIDDMYIDNVSGNGVMLYYFKNYEKFIQLVEVLKVNYKFASGEEVTFDAKIAWRDFSQEDFNFIGVAYKDPEEHEAFNFYLRQIYGVDYAEKVILKLKNENIEKETGQ